MRQIVLLRGINLGTRNRIAMPALRDALTEAGFDDVATYLQSGNVVLTSSSHPAQLVAECERVISDRFDLDIRIVVRSRDELAAIVERNPLGDVADDPRRYQVSFLAETPSRDLVDKLASAALAPERFIAIGRELYAWHPAGIARSRLVTQVAGPSVGVATARNWTTVTSLLTIADD